MPSPARSSEPVSDEGPPSRDRTDMLHESRRLRESWTKNLSPSQECLHSVFSGPAWNFLRPSACWEWRGSGPLPREQAPAPKEEGDEGPEDAAPRGGEFWVEEVDVEARSLSLPLLLDPDPDPDRSVGPAAQGGGVGKRDTGTARRERLANETRSRDVVPIFFVGGFFTPPHPKNFQLPTESPIRARCARFVPYGPR